MAKESADAYTYIYIYYAHIINARILTDIHLYERRDDSVQAVSAAQA